MRYVRCLALGTALAGLTFCGGDAGAPPPTPSPIATTPAPPPSPAPVAVPATTNEACTCTPTDPPSGDYRHAAKHVDLIPGPPQEITVNDVLSWPHTPAAPFDAPRAGRELQLFHISTAYLQNVYVVKDDCDMHMELSAVADPTAQRFVVETPIDASYCPARSALQAKLKAAGLSMTWGTVNSIPVEVTGMAFDDYDHLRASKYVTTTWELHPAVVTILP